MVQDLPAVFVDAVHSWHSGDRSFFKPSQNAVHEGRTARQRTTYCPVDEHDAGS